MRNRGVDDFRLGLVAVGAIILLAASIIIFKDFGFWRNSWPIQVVFSNASGLASGAPVYVSGVKAGQVVSISLRDGRALARIALSRDITISDNARIGISSLGPMGEKCIDIYYLDEPSGNLMAEGMTITGEKPFLAVEVFAEFGKLLSDIGESAASIREIMSMDAGGGDLRHILATGRETFESASVVIREVREISGTLKGRADEATSAAVEILGTLREEINSSRDKLSRIMQDLQQVTKTARGSLEGREGDIGALIDRMSSISGRLDRILNSFDSGPQNAGADLRDFVSRLKTTGENLENISSEARRIFGDDQIKKDVTVAVSKVSTMATTVDQIFAMLNETRFTFDYALRFDEENKLYHSDIHMNIIPAGEQNIFRMGVEDIGGNNDITLQTASRTGNWGKRVGILESRVGLGLDYYLTDYIIYSMDLVDTRHPYLNLSSRYRITRNLDMLLSLKKAFSDQNLNVGLIQRF